MIGVGDVSVSVRVMSSAVQSNFPAIHEPSFLVNYGMSTFLAVPKVHRQEGSHLANQYVEIGKTSGLKQIKFMALLIVGLFGEARRRKYSSFAYYKTHRCLYVDRPGVGTDAVNAV